MPSSRLSAASGGGERRDGPSAIARALSRIAFQSVTAARTSSSTRVDVGRERVERRGIGASGRLRDG